MSACSGNAVAVEFIPVYQNITQIIIQAKLQEAVTGRGMRPPIFVAMVNDQAARFGGFLESLVVIGVAPAAILDSVFIIEVMYHFMQQCGGNFLDGARQCSCADIDFVRAA